MLENKDKAVVRNLDNRPIDLTQTDARLRPAVGTHNIQTLRANRERPEEAGGMDWTYSHQPYLAYWNKTFYLQYLSSPVAEHEVSGRTLLQTSENGFDWDAPQIIFPEYELPNGQCSIMHQRMGFYVSSDDRLLTLAFYGSPCADPWPPTWHMPNDGNGIGRVVREIYRDGSLSPIYFIRYNRHAGYNEGNTDYPFYQEAADAGFIAACDELLADKLATQQWWEEDRAEDGFYTMSGRKAFSYFHRADGQTVGLWKWAQASLSADEGHSWDDASGIPSFNTGGQKMWGQRLANGRYAVVYTPDPGKRYPLAIVTGDDGIEFDRLLSVVGEVAPMRYSGFCKDRGPQYVRGIAEGNPQPEGDVLWLTYSMNKEDIYVSRVPLPVRERVTEPVNDTFDDLPLGRFIQDWNIYSGMWTPIQIIEEGDGGNRCLEMRDKDPFEYASATRVFPESEQAELQFSLKAAQTEWGWLEVDVVDEKGNRPIHLTIDNRGWLQTLRDRTRQPVAHYQANQWHTVRIAADCTSQTYSIWFDDAQVATDEPFLADVATVERLTFRTAPRRPAPEPQPSYLAMEPDLPNGGVPVKEAVYWLDDVRISKVTDERGS